MEWLSGIVTSLLGGLGGSTYVKVIFKVIEWFLDRSKMRKEDVKLFMSFLEKAQNAPRGTVKLRDIGDVAEDDILKQEREANKLQ